MKGQLTIYGVIFAFITILMVSAFAPAFYQMVTNINGNASAAGDTVTPTLSGLVVPFLMLGALMIPVVYTIGSNYGKRQEQ